MVKRLLLFALPILLLWPQAVAQTVGSFNNWCQAGGQVTVTQGLNSSTLVQGSYPQCLVTVFLTGTSTKPTIYSTVTLTPLSDPFTANTDGSFLFFAALSAQYDVTISSNPGPQVAPNVGPSPSFTFADIAVSGSGSGGGGGSGTVTQVNTGAGLTGGPITGVGTISIPAAGVTNAMLQNSSISTSLSGGLTGSASVPLGGTLNLAGNGASGTVSSCAVSKALGIYSATGTAIGCDTLLTESGTQILYGSNGTPLLPAYSFTSAPDSGIYATASLVNTFPISTASRTSNVTTLNMTSLPIGLDALYVGGRIHVAGVTGDTSFNGDFTIATITASTITYAQTGANSSGGTGGTIAPWATGIGGYQVLISNNILSGSVPASPIGFLRLGANDQINYYCSAGSTLNGTTGCNLISGNGSAGPIQVGDGLGATFNGNALDFTATSVFGGCLDPTHSCMGVSTDGNFYMADLGVAPIQVGKVLSVFGMTGVVANLSGAVTTTGSSVTSMGEIIVPVQTGYCQGVIGTANATTYVLAPFVNVANSNACTGTTAMEFPIAAPCTAKNLYVAAVSAGAVAGSGVVTLYKNGAASTLTCTLGTGTTCNDTTHLPTFVAGDTYSLRVLTGQATDTTAGVRAAFACQT